MNAGEGETLVRRYLDDRDSLSDRETLALARWLEEDPARVAELRGDLVLDELLAQKFAVDRRNFPAQVRQRVSDWLRGEQTLDARAAELRAIAAGQLQEYAKRRSSRRWIGWTLAIAALFAFAAATPLLFLRSSAETPSVASMTGTPWVVRDQKPRPLLQNETLSAGDRLEVGEEASVELIYRDGTRITVRAGTSATLAGEKFSAAKLVEVTKGEVVASVSPQPAGAPMTFVTPHSEARVLGTELLLDVSQEATRLEVREGRVEFRRTLPAQGQQPQSVIVKTDQSGLSAKAGLALEEGLWPTRRTGLAFLYAASAAGVSFDDPETGDSRTSTLAPTGRAWFDALYRLTFDGGRFVASDEDAKALAGALSKSGSFSLETTVLASRSSSESLSLVRLAGPAVAQAPPSCELRLQGTKLSIAFAATAASTEPNVEAKPSTSVERDLGEITVGAPLHLVVTYANGRLHAYRDGTIALQEQFDGAGSFFVSEGAELTFGTSVDDAAGFSGKLEAIAIYDRELIPREVRRNSLELRRARSLRQAPRHVVLRTAPVEAETFAKAWDAGPAKLSETTLIFVDLPRLGAPDDRPAYVSLATIVDPKRPGERERVAELLSREQKTGTPLTEMPGLEQLPRGELALPAAHAAAIGAGSQFFVDDVADAAPTASGEASDE